MNKRLVIIFVSIAIVISMFVLGAVFFTVKDVVIVVHDDEQISFDKTEILNTSGIKMGTSIFAVDEDKASENIEKKYPTLKVIKIERVFPNKVRIELIERVGILTLKIEGVEDYLILDRELKVIAVENYEYVMSNNLVPIKGYEYKISEGKKSDDLIGEFISKNNYIYKSIEDIVLSLETFGNINERLCAFANNFTVNEKENYISVKTNLGVSLVLRLNTNKSIKEQMDLIYRKLDSMSDSEREKEDFIYIKTNGDLVVSNQIKFD